MWTEVFWDFAYTLLAGAVIIGAMVAIRWLAQAINRKKPQRRDEKPGDH